MTMTADKINKKCAEIMGYVWVAVDEYLERPPDDVTQQKFKFTPSTNETDAFKVVDKIKQDHLTDDFYLKERGSKIVAGFTFAGVKSTNWEGSRSEAIARACIYASNRTLKCEHKSTTAYKGNKFCDNCGAEL